MIRLAISTCPNDTFAFHALMERKVDWRGLDFRVELMDVQECNAGLEAGEFDVAKASFYAAMRLSDRVGVLPSGSALGYGVGPVLLAAPGRANPAEPVSGRNARVLCPGEWTTASLLYAIFHAGHGAVEQVHFFEIMPALVQGTADFGVCIHEGRFTYADEGLTLVEDLGATWEQQTGSPLPLGGIMARLDLEDDVTRTLQEIILDSILHARRNPEDSLPTMRRHAQELSDDVIRAHVDLYVNDWTIDLGEEGVRAIEALSARARAAGRLSSTSPRLQVVGR
jgi:1,4-dihydroxy-6-naphthoate synthase